MADLFEDNTDDPSVPPAMAQVTELPDTGGYYDALVGDDKKFSEKEGLAKGKWESDLYVKQLQSENASMRAKLTEQESVADMLDKALTQQAAPEPTVPEGTQVASPQDSAAQPVITEEQLQKLVETQVNSRLNEQDRQANMDKCHAAAKAAYGDGYAEVLTERATALGIGQKFLKGIAADQPAAFVKLMVDQTPLEDVIATTSTPNVIPVPNLSSHPGSPEKKNKAYYRKMQLSMKDSDFYVPAIQNEIFAAAKEQGAAFYED